MNFLSTTLEVVTRNVCDILSYSLCDIITQESGSGLFVSSFLKIRNIMQVWLCRKR